MNKKAELTFQSMLYGILIIGLIFSVFALIIESVEPNYDVSNIDKSDLSAYYTIENISTTLDKASAQIDEVNTDPDAFDFFSNIWSKITTPFKFIYRSIGTFKNLATSVVSDLGIFSVFNDFLVSAITIFVIIGLVMIKFYMGRNK